MRRGQCERNDIVAEVAAYVPVDDDGEPNLDLPPMLDLSGDRPYYCNNCDERFKWFSRVLEHLEPEA